MLVYGSLFFTKPFYVLDLVVVSVSLVFETALSAEGGFFVMILFWRYPFPRAFCISPLLFFYVQQWPLFMQPLVFSLSFSLPPLAHRHCASMFFFRIFPPPPHFAHTNTLNTTAEPFEWYMGF